MPQLVYGRHVVALLLQKRPERARRLWLLATEKRGGADAPSARLMAQAQNAQVPTTHASRAELDAMAQGGVHQGVICEVEPFAYAPLEALLSAPGVKSAPLVVVLDQVQDPRNLGALLRSGLAFGASGVLLAKDRTAPMTPAAIKASAGAAWLLPVAQVVNLRRGLLALGDGGVWLTGLCAQGTQSVREVDWREPSAIVLGAEGAGLRPLTRSVCHRLAHVPAFGHESLNVAIAGAIALYEAACQRATA